MLISVNGALSVVRRSDRCEAMQSFRLARGFTLIELMIAVIILGLMIAFAMPSYSIWIQNTRIRSASESFLSGLQLARNEAVRRNSPVRFVVSTGSAWTVSCTAVTPGCTAADVLKIQSRAKNEGSSAAVTVLRSLDAGASNVSADATTAQFDSFGRMTLPVPIAPVTEVRFGFDLTNATRKLRVTVTTGGTVRMCDPTASVAVSDPRHC
jgi:type IV fimbrial biogenesis protein FimT